MTTTFVELDVRPILRAGGEPFEEIMQAVERAEAWRRPAPAGDVQADAAAACARLEGLHPRSKELDGGDWEVLFSPSGQPRSRMRLRRQPPQSDEAAWPEPGAAHGQSRTGSARADGADPRGDGSHAARRGAVGTALPRADVPVSRTGKARARLARRL